MLSDSDHSGPNHSPSTHYAVSTAHSIPVPGHITIFNHLHIFCIKRCENNHFLCNYLSINHVSTNKIQKSFSNTSDSWCYHGCRYRL